METASMRVGLEVWGGVEATGARGAYLYHRFHRKVGRGQGQGQGQGRGRGRGRGLGRRLGLGLLGLARAKLELGVPTVVRWEGGERKEGAGAAKGCLRSLLRSRRRCGPWREKEVLCSRPR